ncbi:MAG: hypothetical protein RIT46_1211 [Pseudomonadota bacterium]
MSHRWPTLISALIVCSCTAQADSPQTPKSVRPQTPATASEVTASERQVYFGEMHLHTSYSFDAWGLMATKSTPDEAYRFGRGEAVEVNGQAIRRGWPLDFMAVTDHSENMGLLNHWMTLRAKFPKLPSARKSPRIPLRASTCCGKPTKSAA